MKKSISAAVVAFAIAIAAPAAAANQAAERYVDQNANAAINALSTADLAIREARFRDLFRQFADLQSLSSFVLGPQGAAALRADPALNREWQAAFLDYAAAVYETQLDRFRGNEIKVVASVDRVPDKDIIVTTEITPRGSTKPVMVKWRILRRGEGWKVLDVAIADGGNELWLAQQQKRDFAPILGPRGDVRALIGKLKEQTAQMRAQLAR
jgi:phospholipid transport system substrate-binding protein